MQASTPDKSGSFVSSSSVDEQAGPGVAFKRLAARYLHPFNLDSSLAKLNIERIRAKARGLSADGITANGYRQVTRALLTAYLRHSIAFMKNVTAKCSSTLNQHDGSPRLLL